MSIEIDLKAIARKKARRLRARAHSDGVVAAHSASRLLMGFLKPYEGRVIAGYMPIGSEIDPIPAMTRMSLTGPVAVPVVVEENQPLRFDRWRPNSKFSEGAYGIPVPAVSEPLVPDVIIVPVLAFDRLGHRLGYGGGYYDRTLAQLRAERDVFAVGLAYAEQELGGLPIEPTDASLDAIVTQSEVLFF
ncbi:5-formyltetrahydrofolate cyclo-ligase [Celeribacter arenosi]|uniref:5-formyltetrahydrofolate cyclo-ligase n=1 Tax=Celeribacter arenosi TaxID=792649 RepID=A0ABP7JSH7_9RHOB